MRSVKGKVFLGLISLIVISILIVTWFYPFSFFSVHKSYTFTADSYVVEGYSKKLNDFKKSYEVNSPEDVTTKLTPYILHMYEQDWLVNKEPISMNEDVLDSILMDVENARDTLFRLTVQGDYTSEQRPYLLDSIKNLLALEEMVESIKNDKWETRSTLKTEFHNLYDAFFSSFNIFVTFYEVSQYK